MEYCLIITPKSPKGDLLTTNGLFAVAKSPLGDLGVVKHLIILLIFLFALSSCGREYNMEGGEMKLVIEGWIDEGEVAQVLLSRSVPISELVDSSNFLNYAVRSAFVTVSDDTDCDTLRLKRAPQFITRFLYVGEKIIGKTGGTYKLTIRYVNPTDYTTQILTAETTIPPSVPIKNENVQYIRQNPTDTTGSLLVDFTHPADQQIYYQFATRVSGSDSIFMPCLHGTFDSRNFDSPDMQVQLLKGVSIFPNANFASRYKDGDRISVRLRTMPKEGFDFWNLWQNEILNAQNPIFPANTSLKSNINGNGGIGIWCGYGQRTVRITAR